MSFLILQYPSNTDVNYPSRGNPGMSSDIACISWVTDQTSLLMEFVGFRLRSFHFLYPLQIKFSPLIEIALKDTSPVPCFLFITLAVNKHKQENRSYFLRYLGHQTSFFFHVGGFHLDDAHMWFGPYATITSYYK